jgi:SAM-dependent methyltransferase
VNDPGQTLRKVFDQEAARYDRVRPPPPDALLDAILTRGQLRAGNCILEVGCGTGQATRPLAEHGLQIYALELGSELAALARLNLQRFAEVTVYTTAFEAFQVDVPFDALVSVQAFHWVGVQLGLKLSTAAVRPGGHLLLAWHQDRSHNTSFYRATDPIYARYPAPQRPRPLGAPTQFEDALATSAHFKDVQTSHYLWQRRYTKRAYLDLLLTDSGVLGLDSVPRQDFLAEIAETIDQHGGTVERHYESVLVVATRT